MSTTRKEATKEAVARPTLKYMRDKDRQMVRGKFHFHECPGGTCSFSFHKYKEDPVERFDLTDGQIYSIPLGVAKHLNQNCAYPVHAYAMDEGGKPLMKIGQMVRRMSFQSLEFVDDEDLSPRTSSIATVEFLG